MTRKTFTLVTSASLALALLAGCEQSPSWKREAGQVPQRYGFGTATANNVGIQSGELQYVIQLGTRFAEEVPNTVNFAFNSATLDAEAQNILRQQAHWIRQFPEVTFKVFGHTDLVGSKAYNYQLGLRRARAVVNFLASQGVSKSRLAAVVSEGENQPLIPTPGKERRNRRTVTEVSGFVQNDPLILNGKYAEVIWREYITSAVPAPQVGEAAQANDAGN